MQSRPSFGSKHSTGSRQSICSEKDSAFLGGDYSVFEKLEESYKKLQLESSSSIKTVFEADGVENSGIGGNNGGFKRHQSDIVTGENGGSICDLKPRHSMSVSDKSVQYSRRAHHSLSLPRNPIITHAIETDEQMIKFNQYVLQNEIGKGSYGICQLVYNEKDNEHYAMKILSKRKLQRSLAGRHPKLRKPPPRGPKTSGQNPPAAPVPKIPKTPLEKVYQEIAILKKLDHPNLVKLVEVLDDKSIDSLCMVFELMEFGEVLPMNGQGKSVNGMPLTEPTARRYFVDCLMALEYLHSKGIIHRDIKPSNILLDVNRHAKIADLGVSEDLGPTPASIRKPKNSVSGSAGTPAFMAPETLNIKSNNIYDGDCLDVWALGVTLYCFAFGEVPFQDEITLALYDKILTKTLDIAEKGDSFGISFDCCNLIEKMLIRAPEERITLEQMREHPWLNLTFDIENSEFPDIWMAEDPVDLLPCKLVSKAENIGEDVCVTEQDLEKAIVTMPNISTIVRIKGMLRKKRADLQKRRSEQCFERQVLELKKRESAQEFRNYYK